MEQDDESLDQLLLSEKQLVEEEIKLEINPNPIVYKLEEPEPEIVKYLDGIDLTEYENMYHDDTIVQAEVPDTTIDNPYVRLMTEYVRDLFDPAEVEPFESVEVILTR